MKNEIQKGLEIAEKFEKLGDLSLRFASDMRKLITSYSDAEIQALYETFWNEIEPNKGLLTKATADELYSLVPSLKELFETNQLLNLVPKQSTE